MCGGACIEQTLVNVNTVSVWGGLGCVCGGWERGWGGV